MKIKLLKPQAGLVDVGTELDVSDDRGLRWIRKGMAEAAGGKPAASAAEAKAEAKAKAKANKK